MSGVFSNSLAAKSNRQAQSIAMTYAAATAAGATFSDSTREGVVDALTVEGGVRGRGVFSDSYFVVPMSTEEKMLVRSSPALVAVNLPDGTFQLQFQRQ